MTSQSRLFKALWWLICLTPPFGVMLAFDSWRARSADEALGGGFIIGPLLLGLTILAPIVLIATIRSPAATRVDKVAASILTIALVPMFALVSASSWWIGWPHRGASPLAAILCLIATVAWVAGAVLLRRWYRRA